jgi:hypothetical protein
MVGVAALAIVLAYYLWSYLYDMYKSNRILKIHKFGVESEARVLILMPVLGRRKNDFITVRVQVEPLSKRNFVADVDIAKLEADNYVKPGRKVLVRYLPDKPREIVLVRILG